MNNKTIEILNKIWQQNEQINLQLKYVKLKNNSKKINILLQQQLKIKHIVNLYNQYKNIINNIKQIQYNILSIKTNKLELLTPIKSKLHLLNKNKKNIEQEIHKILLSNNNHNNKNVIIEIRGAVGGNEGNIFAKDLYNMYIKYAEKQNWTIQLIEKNESQGGFTNISFLLKGNNVYSKMKFESGAHRVQRIPKTENKGRIHTSTATVAVLPEIKEIDFIINNKDLKIDTYKSSGAGGQHVNTTDSAVRITHLPTNITVISQNGRSQHDNKNLAMKHLRSKIYDLQKQQTLKQISTIRKDAIGTGDRSEKIRTYNYSQNRVTDHRINLTLKKLNKILNGDMDELLISLTNQKLKK